MDVDAIIDRAAAERIEGWDLPGYGSVPWDYDAIVADHAAAAGDLLDLGTGGGEWLRAFARRPSRCVATEAWAPNVAVASRALRPVGIPVVHVEGAADNHECTDERRGRLPFRTGSFGCVTARHEAFSAGEIARVLRSGGSFVTQQVDHHSDDDLIELLGAAPDEGPESWLGDAVDQLEAAGLDVTFSRVGDQEVRFDDVGAVVRYLRMAPWVFEGFDVDTFRPRLRELQRSAPVVAREKRFVVVGRRR